ncbi:MAG TPA: methyltransferase domain-containing protein [Acidimicrobiia bacterium]|nr:methyltransferase domain-containing protein [Acidimicrobiia bacterium]
MTPVDTVVLRADNGLRLPLDPARWHAEPTPAEERLLDTMAGPVLDVGCGPGRFVTGLAQRGTVALGVDPAPAAAALCRSRGAPVLQKSVFDPLPGQGRWRTVLLADGNIGIGGDPERLLRRCGQLLAGDGAVVVEVEPASSALSGWRPYRARLERGRSRGPWFCWAVVGADAIGELAAAAGLRLLRLDRIAAEDRCFAHLGLVGGNPRAGA